MLSTGTSVIIFLVIGVVVMALFCLVTRYFNKKLQKALDDQNQVYSMIQEIRGTQEQDADGQYQNYMNNREKQNMPKGKKQLFQLEMTQVKQPLKGFQNPYGMGRLKRRLEGQPGSVANAPTNGSVPLNPQTGRSATSLRSFKPDKLDSLRTNNQLSNTNRTQQGGDYNPQDGKESDRNSTSPKRPRNNNKNDKNKQNITKHTYTSKIVAYIEQGIFIIQNNLMSVTKKSQIQQKRHLKRSTIKPSQTSYQDALEAYGFEKGIYCAFKFQTTLEIPHMKNGEQYPVASLKGAESKEQIQFAEYYSIKDKLQEQV